MMVSSGAGSHACVSRTRLNCEVGAARDDISLTVPAACHAGCFLALAPSSPAVDHSDASQLIGLHQTPSHQAPHLPRLQPVPLPTAVVPASSAVPNVRASDSEEARPDRYPSGPAARDHATHRERGWIRSSHVAANANATFGTRYAASIPYY